MEKGGLKWGRGWKEELGVRGGVTALTCPSNPFTPGLSIPTGLLRPESVRGCDPSGGE